MTLFDQIPANVLAERDEAMSLVEANAGETFRDRALVFVADYLRTHGPTSGETITDAAIAAGIVYVGRSFAGWPGHPLANPFRVAGESDRDRGICVARYIDWLHRRPTLEADLAALWEQCRHGELPLGCWCTPKLCHAHVLVVELERMFLSEEQPTAARPERTVLK